MKVCFKAVSIVLMSMLFASTAIADGKRFTAHMSGAQEVVFDNGDFVPGGVDTLASGRVSARFDKALSSVRVDVKINNLVGNFAGAHFHCGRAGQNGPVAFGLISPGPLSLDGKRIRGSLVNTDFTGADCSPAIGRSVNNIAALQAAMQDGLIYLNIHSDAFPAGEIRGQLGRSFFDY